jgi:hypothetical protein
MVMNVGRSLTSFRQRAGPHQLKLQGQWRRTRTPNLATSQAKRVPPNAKQAGPQAKTRLDSDSPARSASRPSPTGGRTSQSNQKHNRRNAVIGQCQSTTCLSSPWRQNSGDTVACDSGAKRSMLGKCSTARSLAATWLLIRDPGASYQQMTWSILLAEERDGVRTLADTHGMACWNLPCWPRRRPSNFTLRLTYCDGSLTMAVYIRRYARVVIFKIHHSTDLRRYSLFIRYLIAPQYGRPTLQIASRDQLKASVA